MTTEGELGLLKPRPMIDPEVRQSRFDVVEGKLQEAPAYYVQKQEWTFWGESLPGGTPIPELDDLSQDGFNKAYEKAGGSAFHSRGSTIMNAYFSLPEGRAYMRNYLKTALEVKKENVLSLRGKLFELFQPFAGRALFY